MNLFIIFKGKEFSLSNLFWTIFRKSYYSLFTTYLLLSPCFNLKDNQDNYFVNFLVFETLNVMVKLKSQLPSPYVLFSSIFSLQIYCSKLFFYLLVFNLLVPYYVDNFGVSVNCGIKINHVFETNLKNHFLHLF